MMLRRITLAATLAIVPALRAAETDLSDWLHDSFESRALWLYGSNNLALERAPTELPPRTPGKRWVLNSDGRPAAVVYFVPGDIVSVEVDTHRRPGAAGDFTLSVSPDGKIWQALSAVAAPLEHGAGWEYRLLASEAVPAHRMHLRVEFPAGATAETHRLTEVWVRFNWDQSLLTPEPGPAGPASASSAPNKTSGGTGASAPATHETEGEVAALAAPNRVETLAVFAAPASPKLGDESSLPAPSRDLGDSAGDGRIAKSAAPTSLARDFGLREPALGSLENPRAPAAAIGAEGVAPHAPSAERPIEPATVDLLPVVVATKPATELSPTASNDPARLAPVSPITLLPGETTPTVATKVSAKPKPAKKTFGHRSRPGPRSK